MKNYTLLVLAAGMGSRYGGLKQIDALGPKGETIIDYSIYDALQAGFTKVVFVIRKSIESDFCEVILNKYKGKIAVDYVLQEIDALPAHFIAPQDRTKPWGTGHAVLMAKNKIDSFFAVINGDDFYGRNSFKILVNYLNTISLEDTQAVAMVAYSLENTLSEHGSVSRGVCEVNEEHFLTKVTEHTKLCCRNGHIINENPDGTIKEMNPKTPVSMNFWGFNPNIFTHLEYLFTDFLKNNIQDLKSEFYIPFAVDDLIKNNTIQVKVLETDSQWYGVTYQEDRKIVIDKFKQIAANYINLH
ncbi:MAG: sugar phosphate nucleotidyltransferase [Lentimicrobiaceae bacterium]|nr:sugar phosphate nucleotidyltransferase [Lentimicrobiaceae bacterium]